MASQNNSITMFAIMLISDIIGYWKYIEWLTIKVTTLQQHMLFSLLLKNTLFEQEAVNITLYLSWITFLWFTRYCPVLEMIFWNRVALIGTSLGNM